MPDTPDIFDQIASQAAEPLAEPPSAADTDALDEALAEPSQAARTPAQQRAALQYLLANGWVEGGHKPRLYQHIAAHLSALDSLLEPLDLRVQLDDASTEIRMSITVAHHEKNHYGLSCREIDLDSVTHLRRLVTLNAGDDALLTREIALLSTG